MTFDQAVYSEGIGLYPLAHFIFRSVRIKFHPLGDNVGKCIRISAFDGMRNSRVTSDKMVNMEKYGQKVIPGSFWKCAADFNFVGKHALQNIDV